MESFLGIEIGGTKLQIVAGDGNGRIYERRRFSVIQGLGAAGIRQQL
jgi:glucokinase